MLRKFGLSTHLAHLSGDLRAIPVASHAMLRLRRRTRTAPLLSAPPLRQHPTLRPSNGTTARYVEMNDVYHWPGSSGGHPSDVLMPILAAAESVHASGRDFMTALVLRSEIYLRMSDAVKTPGFDCASFCGMGAALGAGKLFGLDGE